MTRTINILRAIVVALAAYAAPLSERRPNVKGSKPASTRRPL